MARNAEPILSGVESTDSDLEATQKIGFKIQLTHFFRPLGQRRQGKEEREVVECGPDATAAAAAGVDERRGTDGEGDVDI